MISGKIILKSGTKLSLDKRFTEIAKQAPIATPRIQQQANVIIPYSRQELFGNRRPNVFLAAQRLKKRSINYRLGMGANPNVNRSYAAPNKSRVFQRLSFGNRRRNDAGANRYLFGGQSGMGVRLRGQGRIRGTRTFRPRTRGYLNNNTMSRYGGFSRRGNMNNRGRGGVGGRAANRGGGRRNGNNNNFNRPNNRGRFGNNSNRGGRGRMNNNKNLTKESLDTEIDKYMAQTKIENDSIEMNAI
ncbi:unnamed protein product [Rotaria magnacalcarata]|uniref:Chromatin target of PRMT1 protein C-terminal domain-containing protein n=2 Tax=Rotaria magnacalcarata TaxID=392030 RepID=A0A814DR14_9BILA|nr:unnamed protein product [Rotaria magnacalcarata]CAF1492280.1 unnamed protein product [Rotaria magnacalcarata]CAF2127657.1 unnamed protein product [Rotaria magnacalcarata]CAF2139928.1 unnamed protein product [Rotaria magnacalcarata]CAF3896404.1 unnamed protein product [Rotaria magnacalcarata]